MNRSALIPLAYIFAAIRALPYLGSLRAVLEQEGVSTEDVETALLAVREEKSADSVLARLKAAGGKLALKAAETGVIEGIKGFFDAS